jgi:hypothetical protein
MQTQEIPADDRKMKELVLYLTAKSKGDPQFSAAKLNKLLFYCDFTAYRQLGRSITGFSYQRMPSGPAPKSSHRASDSSRLSIDDLRLADQVVEDLWESNADDCLHVFIGWQAADLYEVIPYAVVFLGDPSIPLSEGEIEFCRQLEQGAEGTCPGVQL